MVCCISKNPEVLPQGVIESLCVLFYFVYKKMLQNYLPATGKDRTGKRFCDAGVAESTVTQQQLISVIISLIFVSNYSLLRGVPHRAVSFHCNFFLLLLCVVAQAAQYAAKHLNCLNPHPLGTLFYSNVVVKYYLGAFKILSNRNSGGEGKEYFFLLRSKMNL